MVVKLPDTLAICHEPPVEKSLQEMDKLLLLILGAAVQCSQKEELIKSITHLPVETQHAFMPKIKEVTDNPDRIWNKDLNDPLEMEESQRNQLYTLLVQHLEHLVQERDQFSHQIVGKVSNIMSVTTIFGEEKKNANLISKFNIFQPILVHTWNKMANFEHNCSCVQVVTKKCN